MPTPHRSRWASFTLVIALLAALMLQATPQSAAAAAKAQIRYVNGAVGVPALDLRLSGKSVANGLAFGKATKFAPVSAGTHTLTVTGAGMAKALSHRMNLKPGLSYEVALFGNFPTIEVQEFGVLTRAATPGQARLRIVQLAPDLPSVDIAVKGGDVLNTDIIFPGATDYSEFAAGSVRLEIRPTGGRDVILSIPPLTVAEGTIYDIVLIGRAADKTLRAVVLSAKVATSATAPTGPPTAAEAAYLTTFQKDRDLLLLTLQKLDPLLQNPQPNDQNWGNQVALVFQAWVVIDRDLHKTTPPARYQALWSAYAAVVDPLAAMARQQSTVDDYLSGKSNTIDFPNLDLNAVATAVVQVLPLLQDAEAQLSAALADAGLPPLA